VRDPADALAALQAASRVEPGPAPDLLLATVPLRAVLGPDVGEGDAVVEVRLADDRGTEVVGEVRLVTTGIPAVALHAAWDPAEPPPVTAPALAAEG
jgi:hypothetical protein